MGLAAFPLLTRCVLALVGDPAQLLGPDPGQRLTVWTQITAEFSGQPLSALYAFENGVVMVKTQHGEKVTQVGSFNPEWVARRLWQELAAEGKA